MMQDLRGDPRQGSSPAGRPMVSVWEEKSTEGPTKPSGLGTGRVLMDLLSWRIQMVRGEEKRESAATGQGTPVGEQEGCRETPMVASLS